MNIVTLEETERKRKFKVFNVLEDKLNVEEFIFDNHDLILREMDKEKYPYSLKYLLGVTEEKGDMYRDKYFSYDTYVVSCEEDKITNFSTLYSKFVSLLDSTHYDGWKLKSIRSLIVEQTK